MSTTKSLSILTTVSQGNGKEEINRKSGLAYAAAFSLFAAVVAGLLLGWLMVSGLGKVSFIQTYFPLFTIPARDLIFGVLFALALGFVAGILPALQAMRLRLADALRREG